MEPINLEPGYPTMEIPGRCLKCLAEKQLDGCLRQLLMEDKISKEMKQKYAALLSFLQSTESKKLRSESERHLSEGKEVEVKIYSEAGKVKYEMKLSQPDQEESK